MKINSFRDDYRFLSNFWLVYVKLDGVWYPSVEHAYVAAKTLDHAERRVIEGIRKPGEVKRYGRKLTLRPDWKEVRRDIMLDLVRQKFTLTPLKLKLLETGNAELVEGNTWHDNFWGNCSCPRCKDIPGENWLGRILMYVREELKEKEEK